MTEYHHLNAEERATIMISLSQGQSVRFIAQLLNRSPSTVSREIKRNNSSKRPYCATQASKRYIEQRKRSTKPRKLARNSLLCDKIESYLINRKWSPKQIAACLKRDFPNDSSMHVSHETIYSHIYAYPRGELRKLLVSSLRQSKSKRGPRGSSDSCYSSLKIEPNQLFKNRPDEINSRETAGHWEGDLIVGAMNKSCVGTLVERKTGYLLLCKMNSKSAADVRKGFESCMSGLPDFLRMSMTYDRGAEMSQHPIMSKNLEMEIYFADRNAPWQRGSSENINGLIRQFLPKSTDLSVHSQAELNRIAWLLNTRPRKRFEFRSPQTMIETELDGGLIRVALDS